MDVKFNADSAMELLKQMDLYCRGIVTETKALLALTDFSEDWNDYQKEAFRENVKKIAEDLNMALQIESEYMRIYGQKVTELRG